jgi:spermidine synthase
MTHQPRPSWWLRAWSYVRPVLLEQTGSDLNPVLEVTLDKGRYMLCSENAVYSYEDLYDNFADSFRRLPLDAMPIEEVLVLGMGLGSIPQILEQTLHKKYYYTCIEADEEVMLLAEKYVLHELQSGIDVVCADAADWVWVTEQTFDMICVDVFVDAVTPSDFRDPEFLARINDLLNPQGVVLYNCLAYNAADIAAAQAFYTDTFAAAFANSEVFELRANLMLIGYADE